MARIFISHSSQNNVGAIALFEWLTQQGWQDEIFLDLDPERGIIAGERWERKLREAADRCEVVLFLISRAWLESQWCLKELELASKLNKRPFGLLIEDIPLAKLPVELTDAWQLLNLATGTDHQQFTVTLPVNHHEAYTSFSKEGLQRLKHGLEKAGLNAKFFAWPPANEPDRAPYHGLRALEKEDAGIFFGRDAQIVHAMDRLRGIRDAAPPRMLVILGASGAGKSSFMKAGLLPRLERDDRHFFSIPVIRPETSAISGDSGLVAAIETAYQTFGLPIDKQSIRQAIMNGAKDTAALLQKLTEQASRKSLVNPSVGDKPPTLIVPIDQAEELFLAEGSDEASQLLVLMADLMKSDRPAIATLFTIRSDSYDALQTAKAFEGITQQTISLPPMPKGAYRDVITGPAKRLHDVGRSLDIEEALVDKLLRDIEDGGARDALPLLAFSLERLYSEYKGLGALKLDGYTALGGIKGAIEASVEEAFRKADQLTNIPKDRKAREALLKRGLIPWVAGIDPETGTPRRRTPKLSSIPEEARPLMELLVEQRLLATDKDNAGDVIIEPAHEALLRQWSLLNGWLEEDFENLAVLEGVKRAAADWEANNRDPEWLSHSGGRLEEAVKVRAERPDLAADLQNAEEDYLRAAQARDEALKREERQRFEREKRRNRLVTLASCVAAAIMAGLGWQMYLGHERANKTLRESQLSQSKFLTKRAIEMMDNKIYGSVPALLALEASPDPNSLSGAIRKRPPWRIANTALARAENHSLERRIFTGHEQDINCVALSADGRFLVSGSKDKTVRLWSVETGKEIKRFKGHEDSVSSVALSANGRYIVSGSDDYTVRLWSVETGKEIKRFEGHEEPVNSVALSADGRHMVSGSWDKTIRLWSVETGKEIKRFEGHESAVTSVALSADGRHVVSGSTDKTVRLWSVETGKEIKWFEGHEERVTSVAVSADGRHIVSGSKDKAVRLWSVETGKEIKRFEGHEERVTSVALSADGRHIVSGSKDKTVRLWSVETGKEIKRFEGHGNAVTSVALSADGRHIVSGSDDMTVRLWSVETGKEIKRFEGHEDAVLSVAPTADGRHIVNGSGDRTIRLWSVGTGNEIKRFEGHEDAVDSVALSADGRHIVSGSLDRTIRLWSVGTGNEIKRFEGHEERVTSVALSADGRHIVSGSWDNTVRLWSVETGKEIKRFEGHEDAVNSVALSADGRHIVSGSFDRTIRLWSFETGKEIKRFEGHEDYVRSVALSADGRHIVSGSGDKTIRLWSVETGKEIKRFEGHEEPVNSVALSADGRHIVSGSGDNTTRFWILPNNPLLERIHNLVERCLTKYERETYFLDPAPPRWCITGSGREAENDSTKWQPKYPYHTKLWKDWLIAKDAGNQPQLFPFEIATTVTQSMKAGQLHAEKKEYQLAINQLKQALDYRNMPGVDHTQIANVFFERAQIYTMMKEEGKALEDLTQAQNLNHKAANEWIAAKSRGETPLLPIEVKLIREKISRLRSQADEESQKKKYAIAVDLHSKRISLAKTITDGSKNELLRNIYFDRARTQRNKGDYEEAISDFTKSKKLGGAFDDWIWWTKMLKAEELSAKGKFLDGILLATDTYLGTTAEVKTSVSKHQFKESLYTRLWRISYFVSSLFADQKIKMTTHAITECDTLASHPHDPFRVTDGVRQENLDAVKSLEACNREIDQQLQEPRFHLNRARAFSKLAQTEKDAAKAGAHYRAMHDDLEKAMTMPFNGVVGYPMAFNNKGYAYGASQGVEKDLVKQAVYYLETFNRVVHCCALTASQILLGEKGKHDVHRVHRVVKGLLQWAAALNAEGAKEYLENLYRDGVLERSPALAAANFKSVPPWLKNE